MIGAGPQAEARPGRQPPRAASPLRRFRLADPFGDQTPEGFGGAHAEPADQAAVHHRGHSLHREAGLGHIRGQYHLAASCGTGGEGVVLVCGGELAVQGPHIERCAVPPGPFGVEATGQATDLRCAGEEGEYVTVGLALRFADGDGHGRVEAQRRLVGPVVGVHRKQATGRLDDLAWFEQGAHRSAVQGGRHDHDAQIGTYPGRRVEREGQAQISVERPFVELVEHHRGDAGQLRIALQAAGQHPFGHELDRGRVTDEMFVAGGEPDGCPYPLPESGCEETGCGPRSHPPRLQNHNPSTHGIAQGQRHSCRLARSGCSRHHHPAAVGCHLDDVAEDVIDG